MEKKTIKKSTVLIPCLYLIIPAVWLILLRKTSAEFSVYVFYAVISAACVFGLQYRCSTVIPSDYKSDLLPSLIVSLFFSTAVCLADYAVFTPIRDLKNIAAWILTWLLGVVISCPVCLFLNKVADSGELADFLSKRRPLSPAKTFWISFFGIAVIDLLYVYFAAYPGNLSIDSLSQIDQSLTGHYVNQHPFWHTIIIHYILQLGTAVFGSLETAIFLFSVCQILFISVCFSFILVTLSQASRSGIVWICCLIYFIFYPCHTIYSCTMWKDVPFGVAVAVFITALYRLMKYLGSARINYVILIVSAAAFGIWRTNGVIALAVTFLIVLLMALKQRRFKLTLCLAGVLAFTLLLNGPVLNLLHIESSRYTEKLSVPIQQVSRVIHDGYELNDASDKAIDKILDTELIAEKYDPKISDPIKFSVSDESDAYLKEHKGEYLKVWADIGVRYPAEYVKAWIDQTKGYWNAGYHYWRWANVIEDNDLGLERTVRSGLIYKAASVYLKCWDKGAAPLLGIGEFTLFFVYVLVYGISRRKKETLLVIPLLAITLTLLIATPVFSEFRYVYAYFTAFPVILVSFLYSSKNDVSEDA